MNIIAHRGFWHAIEEKNTIKSINRAFENGYGIEIDIRDYVGELVISHDIADDRCPSVEKILQNYVLTGCEGILALNIKADGIQVLLKHLLRKYHITNYFLFDMSIPELVVYERERLHFYTRHSDIESVCIMYEKADGVWLDSIYDKDWLTADILSQHISCNKKMSIISPEIHGFDYLPVWKMLKDNGYHRNELIALCTDLPEKARKYFYE